MLLITKDRQKNIARRLEFGTNEGNLAIGLFAGVFALLIGVTLVRLCMYYRQVQREIRMYERGEEEEAERQARVVAAYGPMEKERYLRGATGQEVELKTERHIGIEARSPSQFSEEQKENDMESSLSGVPQSWAAQMTPEVGLPPAVGGQTPIGAGKPHASACSLTVENLWLHDRGASLQTDVSKEYGSTGLDGDGVEEGDQTELPSVYCPGPGPESLSDEGPEIPAICGLRMNTYRVTNGNEASSSGCGHS